MPIEPKPPTPEAVQSFMQRLRAKKEAMPKNDGLDLFKQEVERRANELSLTFTYRDLQSELPFRWHERSREQTVKYYEGTPARPGAIRQAINDVAYFMAARNIKPDTMSEAGEYPLATVRSAIIEAILCPNDAPGTHCRCFRLEIAGGIL